MPRTKNFDTINKLPAGAMTVKEYCVKNNIKNTSLIYHRITRGKADYQIKVFQGINFVIPIS